MRLLLIIAVSICAFGVQAKRRHAPKRSGHALTDAEVLKVILHQFEGDNFKPSDGSELSTRQRDNIATLMISFLRSNSTTNKKNPRKNRANKRNKKGRHGYGNEDEVLRTNLLKLETRRLGKFVIKRIKEILGRIMNFIEANRKSRSHLPYTKFNFK